MGWQGLPVCMGRAASAFIFCIVFMSSAWPACGADPSHEVRSFNVTIDGKDAGSYTMSIDARADGTQIIEGHADIKLTKYLVYNYTYKYDGTEIWKNDRLQTLDSSCNDDGKKYTVKLFPEGDALRVKTHESDSGRQIGADVWTTTYWRLVSPKFRNGGGVYLLDADTGRYMAGTMMYVGQDFIDILGKKQKYNHYHMTGGDNGELDVHLWYDGFERLVKQVAKEDGHVYVLTLGKYNR